jgi:cytochrome c biogenesis protein CcmG, thiol:disulfide interchange protein DsbE
MTDTASPETTSARPRRLPVWVIILAFVLLIGFMALIGWGLNRSMQGSMSIGDPAQSFTMTTFDQQQINTSQYAGKVILVNFWASWCQPCEQEAAALEEAYQHYKPGGQVVFIGLAYVDTEPKSVAYLQKFGVTYPNGPDLATRISQMYRVRGVPETFIIDPNGRLAYFQAGPFTSTDQVISIIDGILKK